MRYRLGIVAVTVVLTMLRAELVWAYSGPDDYAVSAEGWARGRSEGNGGLIDIRTGVRVDTGPGYDPATGETTPVDVNSPRTLDAGEQAEYFFRQVVGYPKLTIIGDVTIHCQFVFNAEVIGDFSSGVPSVTIYAGHTLEIEPDLPWWQEHPPGHEEAMPRSHYCKIRMTCEEMNQKCDGGRVRFYTTQHGNIGLPWGVSVDGGGSGDDSRRGGNGGQIILMANDGDIIPAGEAMAATADGGAGRWAYKGRKAEDGGHGGTILARAKSIAGHFRSSGGKGGDGDDDGSGETLDGGDGGNGGVIAVAVDDDSGLVMYSYGGRGGRAGTAQGESGAPGVPGQILKGGYTSNPIGGMPPLPGPDTWTIMLYSAADDNTDINRDMEWANWKMPLRRHSIEAALAGVVDRLEQTNLSETYVNLLVLMDRNEGMPMPDPIEPGSPPGYDFDIPQHVSWGQWHNTRWGWVTYDDNISVPDVHAGYISSVLVRPDPEWDDEASELNTGVPSTLSSFGNWAMGQAKANHYILSIQGHGQGWEGIALDDTDRDILSWPELVQALDSMGHVDIVALDACICATAEALGELAGACESGSCQPKVEYVIAAQTRIYGTSSALIHKPKAESWLRDLAEEWDPEPKDLAIKMGEQWKRNNEVHAAFDLAAYGDFHKAMRRFVAAATNRNVSKMDFWMMRIIRDETKTFPYGHRDLLSFMSRLANADDKNAVSNGLIRSAAGEVSSAILKMRIAHTAPSHQNEAPGGLSVWFPSNGQGRMSKYKALAFAKNTGWWRFLRQINVPLYDLHYFPDDVSDNLAAAQPVDVLGVASVAAQDAAHSSETAQAVTGAVVESYLNSSHDLDWYQFEADAGQVLYVEMVGLSDDLFSEGRVTIYTPQQDLLMTAEPDHTGAVASSAMALPASGTYYAQVSSNVMSIPEEPAVGEGLYSLTFLLHAPDAYEPNLVADTSGLDFRAVEGSEAQVGTITLTNTGGTSIKIVGLGLLETVSPFFAPYSPLATPFILGPGEPIEIDIGMQPYSAGVAEDTLVVVPADANYPALEIPLRASTYDANSVFTIGGAVYTDANNPAASGLEGVRLTLSGGLATYTAETSGSAGLWQIKDVPEGTYTLTPSRSGYAFEHVSAGIPDGQASIGVEVNEAQELANQDIQFLAQEAPVQRHDWNGDGIISIVGDVPPFVQCAYFGQCPDGIDAIAVGDCNGDGILSIVGDVPCFVNCVYFGNCDID